MKNLLRVAFVSIALMAPSFSLCADKVVLPKNVLVKTNFEGGDVLSAQAQSALKSALVEWVSYLEPNLYIGLNEGPTFIPDLKVEASFKSDEDGRFTYTIEVSGSQLSVPITFKSPEPIRPDARLRNLSSLLFSPFDAKLQSYLKPGSSVPVITFTARPNTRLFINGKLFDLGDSGQVDVEYPMGFVLNYEAFLDDFYPVRSVYNIDSANPKSRVDIIQEPYQNPALLGLGFEYLAFPSFSIGVPLDRDALFLNIPVNFFGVGINPPDDHTNGNNSSYAPNPSLSKLFVDNHLLELGIGLLWYMDNREWQLRPVFGLDLLARFDLQGKYFLDLTNPLALELKAGVEIQLDKKLSLGFELHPNYTLSFDPQLTLAVQTPIVKKQDPDFFDDLRSFLTNKYVVGPGILELFNFAIVVRLQN